MKDALNKNILSFDKDASVNKISDGIKKSLRLLRKRGVVVAVSGGIDSSVTAALCVKALGAKKVFGLLLPEHDSSSESVSLGEELCSHLGIEHLTKNIGPTLEQIGCYQWRDEAIRKIFPDYTSKWKNKIAIVGGQKGMINHFNLIVKSPEGKTYEARMDLNEYLQIVAATNFKQRIRKNIEFFHADRLNFAVIGTPNRLEYDQGFFVKNGDGAADIKPIAHLYKSQVYALAKHLELPENICNTTPTTDTYSLEQGQDEFYFALPYDKMDVALWYFNHDRPADELADSLGISQEHAEFIYKDIQDKRRTTASLHWMPLVMEKIKGPVVNYSPIYE